MPTCAACLTCISRIHFDKHSASLFRFARESFKECRPRGVCNAFCQTMMMHHPINHQVFYTNNPKTINYLPTVLMGEIITSKLDTFMHTSNGFPVLPSFSGPLRKFGVFALYFCEGFFFCAKKVGILYFFSSGESSKRLQPDINSNSLGTIWQPFRFTRYRKGDIPLSGAPSVDSARFDGASDLAMRDHFDTANFGEANTGIVGDAKATLRKGERSVASFPTKTRVSRVFTGLASPEECLESKIDPNGNILEHLRMHRVEGGALFFQYRIGCLLLIARQALASLLIGRFAHFKQMIVEPSALFKRCLKLFCVAFCRVDPVLEHLYHKAILAEFKHVVNSSLNVFMGKGTLTPSPKQGTPIHPLDQSQGLSGPFTVNSLRRHVLALPACQGIALSRARIHLSLSIVQYSG